MINIYNEFTEPRAVAEPDRITWKDFACVVIFLIWFYFAGLVLWACLA